MIKKTRSILMISLLSSLLCACTTMQIGSSYLPETFTTQNIMTIHPGMTSDEILKLFGNPKSVSQGVCGGDRWICITWEYGKFPYDRARFTFNGNDKPPTLNNFDIDRKDGREILPESFSTENIMKIRQGMRSAEVLKLFGFPKDVSQAVCGDRTWLCTTWEYGNFPYQRASFTFSGNHEALILNNFKIDKD